MLKKVLAEFIATMILVLVGCGVAIGFGTLGITDAAATTVGIAAAFGVSIVILAYSVGQISGGHANPAVSLAMAIRGDISWKEFALYCIAQICGAFAGSGILALIFMSVKSTGANSLDAFVKIVGATDYNFGVVALGLLAEIVLTFLFIFVVLGVTSKKEWGGVAGVVIGIALFGVHLLGIPLTGTSVNPARALSALVLNMFADTANKGHNALTLIAVVVGPFIGAAFAALLWKVIFGNKKEAE